MDAIPNHFVISGHTLDDYRLMFDLDTLDLHKSIINFGCAFDSFNAEMYNQKRNVTSFDNIYEFGLTDLQQYVDNALMKMEKHFSTCTEKLIPENKEQFFAQKRQSANTFLHDFPLGLKQKRYQNFCASSSEPLLGKFHLALSSHYLFVREDLTLDQHLKAICEACRVANELRIFPLNEHDVVSPILGPVLLELQKRNFGLEIRQVNYEIQKGSNAMLRVWNKGVFF